MRDSDGDSISTTRRRSAYPKAPYITDEPEDGQVITSEPDDDENASLHNFNVQYSESDDDVEAKLPPTMQNAEAPDKPAFNKEMNQLVLRRRSYSPPVDGIRAPLERSRQPYRSAPAPEGVRDGGKETTQYPQHDSRRYRRRNLTRGPSAGRGPGTPHTESSRYTFSPDNLPDELLRKLNETATDDESDEAVRRGGQPATSCIPEDGEVKHITETVWIDPENTRDLDAGVGMNKGNGGSFLQPWIQKRARPWIDAETELLVINGAESFADENGQKVVTLFCQESVLDNKVAATPPNQNHWLHIRCGNDVIQRLKGIILHCPLISNDEKSLALGLLKKKFTQGDSLYDDAGAKTMKEYADVSRMDGRRAFNRLYSKSVILASTPYVFIGERKKDVKNTSKSLCGSYYGHHVTVSREQKQVLPETHKWLGKEIVNVGEMSYLLIGTNVLISWADLPLSALRKDSLLVEEGTSRPLIMVRVKHHVKENHCFYIKNNISLAEVVARIKKLTLITHPFHICLDTPGFLGRIPITSSIWAQLLEESSATLSDLHLRLVVGDARRLQGVRRPYDDPSYYQFMRRWGRLDGRRTTNREMLNGRRLGVNQIEDGEEPLPSSAEDQTRVAPPYQSGAGARDIRSDRSDAQRDHGERKEDAKFSRISPRLKCGFTPFLLWKVTRDTENVSRQEGNMTTLRRLLTKVEKSLDRGDDAHDGCDEKYECSFGELSRRYEPLDADICGSISSHEILGSTKEPAGEDEDGADIFNRPSSPVSAMSRNSSLEPSRESKEKSPGDHTTSAAFIQQCDKVIIELFKVSRYIMRCFVPEEVSSSKEHTVINLYWGALDTILRYVVHLAKENAITGDQVWTIRDISALMPLGGCVSCQKAEKYTLDGALEHLHSFHSSQALGRPSCPGHATTSRPYEDPCVVWLQGTEPVHRSALWSDVMTEVERFLANLWGMLEKTQELHLFLARNNPASEVNDESPQVADDGNKGIPKTRRGTAGRSATQKQWQEQKERPDEDLEVPTTPALPSNLLRAFEEILKSFRTTARIIARMTRRAKDAAGEGEKARPAYQRRREGTFHIQRDIMECLDGAREDLILGITAADRVAAIRMGAVGLEYIGAMILANVQNGTFHFTGSHSADASDMTTTIRSSTRRSTIKWIEGGDVGIAEEGHAIPPTTKRGKEAPRRSPTIMSLNLLALYSSHLLALDFSAKMDPRRQTFLALEALDHELLCLSQLCGYQRDALEDTARVLKPSSFGVTTKKRIALYPLERDLLDMHKERRNAQLSALENMRSEVAALQVIIRQMIAVLDEDHSKAIRVFTLVTLLFLPLSFISSVFGMNTVDVRDMASDQRVYWATSLPVTLAVMLAAYYYAYIWDSHGRPNSRTWLHRL